MGILLSLVSGRWSLALPGAAIPLSLVLSITAPGYAVGETAQVEDSRGKLIEIERPVKSVAIFPLPIPEAMIALDGGSSA